MYSIKGIIKVIIPKEVYTSINTPNEYHCEVVLMHSPCKFGKGTRYENSVFFAEQEKLNGFVNGMEVQLIFSIKGREFKSPQQTDKFYNTLIIEQIKEI